MKKRNGCKGKVPAKDLTQNSGIPRIHDFNESEVEAVRSSLLAWYDDNKRDMPWRTRAKTTTDPNQRAYAVWVSEIMLQQTQVATVIDYYNRWMEKWPTLQELAKATLEEKRVLENVYCMDVNTMWAGLGYYSRGRRLLEGAKKVVEELDGKMPATAEDLVKTLPGVGRYTAGAIASIAFNQTTGLVDGNVVRVLCRMRMMGADCTSQPVQDTLWSHASKLVDRDRPGDFNQSLMELGATVCTPKSPSCSECPVRWHCKAYAQVEYEKKSAVSRWTKVKVTDEDNNIPDVECAAESCKLCIPSTEEWDPSEGVMNYPRKPKKKPPRVETTSVCLVCCHHEDKSKRKFLVLKRKEEGLLAGLWEFPSMEHEGTKKEEAEIWLQTNYSLCLPADTQIEHVGQVVHHFSHITQTYMVDCLVLSEELELDIGGDNCEWKWMTGQEFLTSAISTAMKKVFNAFEKGADNIPVKNGKRKRESPALSKDGKKQASLYSFFQNKVTLKANCK